jgi:uncharacterized protein (TIGR00255 family)
MAIYSEVFLAGKSTAKVYSMTGFGQSCVVSDGTSLHCEISALNHKYFDFSYYAPPSLIKFEPLIRKRVKSKIQRGRIRLNIYFSGGEDPFSKLRYSPENAQVYLDAFSHISKITRSEIPVDPNVILSSHSVIAPVKSDGGSIIGEEMFMGAVDEATEKLLSMRKTEGSALAEDLGNRMKNLLSIINEIEKRIPFVKKEYGHRLKERIAEWEMGAIVSEERLAQELFFFCERSDITEEIVRTRSHVNQFLDSLAEGVDIGRKLVFISQEINREATTIGAKASDPEINRSVVLFKEELAKVREQSENIE